MAKTIAPSAKQNTTSTKSNAIKAAKQTATVATASPSEKTSSKHLLESRSDWENIYSYAVTLVVKSLKGEALGDADEARKGFAFKAMKDSPNCRSYAKSLFAGLLTGKAGKVFKGTQFAEVNLEEVACNILVGTKLAKSKELALDALKKAEPKQAKTFSLSILAQLA